MQSRVIISYGANSSAAAKRLRAWLAAYRTPKGLAGAKGQWGAAPARFAPVDLFNFEEETDPAQAEAMLAAGETLIVLGTEGSAGNLKANNAVVTFRVQGKGNRIFPVLAIAGTNLSETDLFPPALLGQSQPLADLGDLAGKDSRLAFLALVARMLGVEHEALLQQEMARRGGIIMGLGVGAAAAAALGVVGLGAAAVSGAATGDALTRLAATEESLDGTRADLAATRASLADAQKDLEAALAEIENAEQDRSALADKLRSANAQTHEQMLRAVGAIARAPDQAGKELLNGIEYGYARLAEAPDGHIDPENIARVLRAVGDAHIRAGAPERALRAYGRVVAQARKLAERRPNDLQAKVALADSLRDLARVSASTGNGGGQLNALTQVAALWQAACAVPGAAPASTQAVAAKAGPVQAGPISAQAGPANKAGELEKPAEPLAVTACLAFAQATLDLNAARRESSRPPRADLVAKAQEALAALGAAEGLPDATQKKLAGLQRRLERDAKDG